MTEQILDIGGISVSFRFKEDAYSVCEWDAAHKPFISSCFASGVSAAALISVHSGHAPAADFDELLADGRLWTLSHDSRTQQRRIILHGGPYGPLGMVLDLDPVSLESPLTGNLYLGPIPPGHSSMLLGYPLMPLLWTILLGKATGEKGGLLCHACGIKMPNGEGLLFSGFSGAGKSTTSRLWRQSCPEATILSDDRIILRPSWASASGFVIHGTPWHGDAEEADPCSAPLNRVLILGRSSDGLSNQFVPLSPAMAAAELLARTTPPIWDKSGTMASLILAATVCQSLPVGRWEFAPTPQAVFDLLPS